MSISFAGLDQMVVTFQGENVTTGSPVVMKSNGTVTDAGSGEKPVGIALNTREGYTGVLLRGYAEVSCSGSLPELGWANLLANGKGGLKQAGSSESGWACLVVDIDDAEKTVGLFF